MRVAFDYCLAAALDGLLGPDVQQPGGHQTQTHRNTICAVSLIRPRAHDDIGEIRNTPSALTEADDMTAVASPCLNYEPVKGLALLVPPRISAYRYRGVKHGRGRVQLLRAFDDQPRSRDRIREHEAVNDLNTSCSLRDAGHLLAPVAGIRGPGSRGGWRGLA